MSRCQLLMALAIVVACSDANASTNKIEMIAAVDATDALHVGTSGFTVTDVQSSVDPFAGLRLAKIEGAPGPTGATGPRGATGPTGGVGPQGPGGNLGPAGPTGPSGVNGAPGPNGFVGPPGAAGATGAQGPTGSPGAAGPTGVTGVSGSDGQNGAQGPTGPTGPSGTQGATGPNGSPGATGALGLPGLAGANGSNGTQGPAGPTGPTGTTGTTGTSGPVGPAGPTGASGAAGASGAQGGNGVAGVTGTSGTTGPTGASGATGPTGFTTAQWASAYQTPTSPNFVHIGTTSLWQANLPGLAIDGDATRPRLVYVKFYLTSTTDLSNVPIDCVLVAGGEGEQWSGTLSKGMSTWVMIGLTIAGDFSEPVSVVCQALTNPTLKPTFTFSSYTLVKIGLESVDVTGNLP